MGLIGKQDGRNFEYGRHPRCAGGNGAAGHVRRRALRHGEGGRESVESVHQVVPVEDGPGMNDARRINRQVLAYYEAYVPGHVERDEITVSTGQNCISGVNRTMAALCGDQYVKVPSSS
jgi:hypothetical protein